MASAPRVAVRPDGRRAGPGGHPGRLAGALRGGRPGRPGRSGGPSPRRARPRLVVVGEALAPALLGVLPGGPPRLAVPVGHRLLGVVPHLLGGHHAEVGLEPVHRAHRTPHRRAPTAAAPHATNDHREANRPFPHKGRSDTHLVGTVTDRDLQVTAHPGRQRGGLRVARAQPGRGRGDVGERRLRVGAQRGHAHQPGQPQPGPGGHVVGQREPARRPAPRRGAGSPSTLYCTSTGSGPARPPAVLLPAHRGVQRVGQPDAVHRLHPVRPADHRARLVPLQAADEVPARRRGRAQPGHLGHLGRGLLHPVLAERGQPEVEQQRHVGGRHGLGHGQQGHRLRVPAGGARRPPRSAPAARPAGAPSSAARSSTTVASRDRR